MERPDPFFKAKYKPHGNPWGQHEGGYIEDLYRTFGKSKLPERDHERFGRAYQFREKELQEQARQKEQHMKERQHYDMYVDQSTRHIKELTTALRSVTEQYSKLKKENDGWRSAQSTAVGSARDRPDGDIAAESVRGPVDEPEVQHSGVCADVESDTRGQGSEHDSEGRHAGGADPEGGVRVREGSVPEGGAD